MSSTTTVTTVGNNSKRDDECELKKKDQEMPDCGRERLKRHRGDVSGRVWIPDIWGQEDYLKDWVDCTVFDASLAPKGLMSARKALAQEQESRRSIASYTSGRELSTASC